ncbi:MAG: amidohydrolase/deacetylase family metallohydrolase [Candidatus Symbiobacter sp.]|nr:amidohydrolase/deacetylase family metallohydrolase [Candidatus Symbiobacter sp.]
MYDVILRQGRVIDPKSGHDAIADVGFAAGKVAYMGASCPGSAAQEIDVTGLIVTPGLIDLHTHVYWGGTSLGVDADAFSRRDAVTTMIDTGSAGAGNFPGFRKHVIEPATARILVLLHVSFAGIYGFSKRVMVPEGQELRLFSAEDCVETIEANRDLIVGVKVRIGRNASGTAGLLPLEIGLQVADRVGLPLMCHIDFPPPSYADTVALLRPGDILTHAFRPFPNAPYHGAAGHEKVRDEVWAARQRGVIFDIGHGMGSFSYHTARIMLSQGFAPDTISSDVHALSQFGPAFDLTTSLSKFLALGVKIQDVIAAATTAPAAAIRRPDLGHLAVGGVGDASILRLAEGSFDLVDVEGEHIMAEHRLLAAGMVMGGKICVSP